MRFHRTSAFAIAAAASLAAGTCLALSDDQLMLFSAAGACQANTPATSDVRVRVGGILNAGATSIYVVCSVPAEWTGLPSGNGVNSIEVKVSNTGAATAKVNCTLAPGPTVTNDGTTTAQGAFPKQRKLPADSNGPITWGALEVLGYSKEIASPSVICLLPPRTMIHYIAYSQPLEIGA